MIDHLTPETQAVPRRLALWLIRLLALAAVGIATYLWIISLATDSLPVGCGVGSDCASLLTSKWSRVWGVPLGAMAVLLYSTVLVATIVASSRTPRWRHWAWMFMVVAAVAIACTVAWFVALQVVVLRTVCPWCMASHVVGAILAIAILVAEPVIKLDQAARGEAASTTGDHSLEMRFFRALLVVSLGTVVPLLMVTVQLLSPALPSALHRLPVTADHDSGAGSERRIELLGGELGLTVHQEMVVGSPDAPTILVLMYDYCCRHCAESQAIARRVLQRYPGQVALLALPMPLGHECNPHVQRTEVGFELSCKLARLALAVGRTDTTAFSEFDQWLFSTDTLPTADGARRQAESIVGADRLAQALADPWVDRMIARNVAAHHKTGTERLPLMLAAGFAPLVGAAPDPQQLFQILEHDLGMVPAAE